MRLQREKEREGRARSKKGEEDSGDAPQVPEWAEDVDPAHVVSGKSGKLPDIREELKGRLKVASGAGV